MEDAKNIILITPLQIMNILKQGKKKNSVGWRALQRLQKSEEVYETK